MVVGIIFNSCKGMNMLIGGAQLICTMHTSQRLPIFSILIRGVGSNFCDPLTCSTGCPVTGFICAVFILMGCMVRSFVTAGITICIAVRREVVLADIGFLATSDAIFPVMGSIRN